MKVLRLPEVKAKTGLKHTAIYEQIADAAFPRPVPLSEKAKGAKGWIESEIDDWIRQRIARRDSVTA
jgi:prophage regulatory protein